MMIKKVADLLNSLKEKELEIIEKYGDIGHNPTIGSMYEGLTRDLLQKTIFDGLDIRVVSGKIINSKREYSDQIDCMIVQGEGEKIPHTDLYIYHINNVIAVIEVKKNLYSAEMRSAYQNLRSVKNIFEPRDTDLEMIEDSFFAIYGKNMPEYKDIKNLPINEQMMAHSLILEASLPIRIVFGYNGFKSEISLRNSFLEYLKEHSFNNAKKMEKGFGILNLPNLIVCDKFSLIKLNGMPYALRNEKNDGSCEIYGSYAHNPILLLIELIWTRLIYQYKINVDSLDDDLEIESINRFLSCEIIEFNGKCCWNYNYHDFDADFLAKTPKTIRWEPVFVSLEQYIIFNLLCNAEYVYISNINTIVDVQNVNIFVDELLRTSLVTKSFDNKLYLLTRECKTAILPDGQYIVGDDVDGRFTQWISRYMDERRKGKTL